MTRIDAGWMAAPATAAVMAALAAAGHRTFFVGGCVRNTLLRRDVSDIDIATNARPDQTVQAAEDAGLKAVPTGAEHGTITVVAGGIGFEVTTFRRDVETFGRHARVVFSDKLEDDAARRDFTMNALYADARGTVVDPVGGLEDLRAGRLRFIGDAAARIAEDSLRILRFFRFHAWYADPAKGFDPDGLAACEALAEGIDRLPAERIGQEIRKLLDAPDPAPATRAMERSGILTRVLPGAQAAALPALMRLETALAAKPDAMRRLATLGGAAPADRLRLSRAEARRLAVLSDGVASGQPACVLAYRHGADAARDIVLVRAARDDEAVPADVADRIAKGAAATFPIAARDLMPGLAGAELGAALSRLEAEWIASGFRATREDLLSRL